MHNIPKPSHRFDVGPLTKAEHTVLNNLVAAEIKRVGYDGRNNYHQTLDNLRAHFEAKEKSNA